MALGAVAHAELQPEIYAEADEQHEKRDGDHVQRANQKQADGRRNHQTGDQADDDRQDDARRAQRQPQDDENRAYRDGHIEHRVALYGRELVVIHRHQPGQPHPRVIVAVEVQLPRRFRDSLARRAARLQRREIEHRLDLDEPAQFLRFGRFAAGESTPGKTCGPAGQGVLDGVGGHGHRPSQIVELDLPVLHAHQAQRQCPEGSPEARIGGQCLEHRTSLGETTRQPRHLARRQVQQPVPFEESSALHLVHRPNAVRAVGERPGELCRGLINQLRGRRIDNDEHVRLRKRLDVFEGPLRPRQIGRKEVLDVGLDAEMAHRIDR